MHVLLVEGMHELVLLGYSAVIDEDGEVEHRRITGGAINTNKKATVHRRSPVGLENMNLVITEASCHCAASDISFCSSFR